MALLHSSADSKRWREAAPEPGHALTLVTGPLALPPGPSGPLGHLCHRQQGQHVPLTMEMKDSGSVVLTAYHPHSPARIPGMEQSFVQDIPPGQSPTSR